jgi:aminobenzoyl-glutamate utilization protein B
MLYLQSGLTTATWIPGTPAHSWQAAACGGKDMAIRATVISFKGPGLYSNRSLFRSKFNNKSKGRI